jgi:hypothetical protein
MVLDCAALNKLLFLSETQRLSAKRCGITVTPSYTENNAEVYGV